VIDASRYGVIYGGSVPDVKDQWEDSAAMCGDQIVECFASPGRSDYRVASANCRICEGLPEPSPSTGDEPYTRHFPTHLFMPRIIAGKSHPVKAASVKGGTGRCSLQRPRRGWLLSSKWLVFLSSLRKTYQ
jgi:hypothetical protein